ncbi:MAG: DUF2975 domain-containing protein [Verrucomicrobiota bacterium]
MNATETSPVANGRTNRITMVSGIFKVLFLALTLVCVVASVESVAALLIAMMRGGFRRSVFASDWFSLLGAGSDLVGAMFAWFCYKLFALYSRGDFFTAEVVHSLRRIGVMFFFVTLAGALLAEFMPHTIQHSVGGEIANSILNVGNGLFVGFLILFIAWVMDEGRRIQEEQALTV